jgi:hypothetical protein
MGPSISQNDQAALGSSAAMRESFWLITRLRRARRREPERHKKEMAAE